jgi:hypothetical protein
MSPDPNAGYEGEVGIGEYRGPGERWQGPPSEHAPERAFDDAQNTVAEAWVALADELASFGRLLASQPQDGPIGVASGNTDASGNLYQIVYKVAAGEQFRLTRAVCEANGQTPASPFSAASAWVALYATDLDQVPGGTFTGLADALQGGQVMFGPPIAGGPILPFMYTAVESEAPEIRGPANLVLVVNAGPTTRRITLRYQGTLTKPRGVA